MTIEFEPVFGITYAAALPPASGATVPVTVAVPTGVVAADSTALSVVAFTSAWSISPIVQPVSS